jgi:branched-chain amino acid aminotransferase
MISKKLQNLYDEAVVNINGEITNAKEAKVSIFDRGFLYGDSIYEVTYAQDYTLLFLDEHLDRLEKSAHLINMHLFVTREYIQDQVLKTLTESQMKDAYIRIIVTRGETEITLDPNASFKNNVVIIVKSKPQYPESFYQQGMRLAIVSILRNDKMATDPNAKSGNYLNNVMAIAEAKKLGADDALMTNKDGQITEGTTFNIWMYKDGYWITPPATSGLLEGITRKKTIEICKEQNIPFKEENFTTEDILNAQEVFITSSTRGIMPVGRINDKIYGKGIDEWKETKTLQSHFQRIIEGHKQCKDYYYGLS